MFGRKPECITSFPEKEFYKLYLKSKSKTDTEIINTFLPADQSMNDQVADLAVMMDLKIFNQKQIKLIEERDDKLAQYLKKRQEIQLMESSTQDVYRQQVNDITQGLKEYILQTSELKSCHTSTLAEKISFFKKCKNPNKEMRSDPHFHFFRTC